MDASDLSRPEFASQDTAALLTDLLTHFEQNVGRPLYPGQVERLLLHSVAYGLDLVRADIQHTGEQNLVAYANGLQLDHLAARWGLKRLPQEAATTRVVFKLTEPFEQNLLISAGRELVSKGNKVIFQTLEDVLILAGEQEGRCIARCTSAGPVGNGWEAGTIERLAIPQAEIAVAYNETTSNGGSDIESDIRLRKRILAAPHGLSTVGTREGYRLHVLGVSPDIIDVAVMGPDDRKDDDKRPGDIDIYPLYENGLVTDSQSAEILAALNHEKIRPLGDSIHVYTPKEVKFSIAANLIITQNANGSSLQATAENTLRQLVANWGLGQDIVASDIIRSLQNLNGVYSVDLLAPTELITVPSHSRPKLEKILISIVGVKS